MKGGNKTKAVAYSRVSTLLGQDIENQLVGIRNLAVARGFDLIAEFNDVGVSGLKEKRPQLNEMVNWAKKGKFKIIIVHSIDRLGRSTKHLLTLLDELAHFGVSMISIRENLDFSSPTGKMALTMLSAVAQLEAMLISERISTAMAVKKQNAIKNNTTWKCGRPKISNTIVLQVIKLRSDGHSIRQISKILKNVSKSSVERILKEHKSKK